MSLEPSKVYSDGGTCVYFVLQGRRGKEEEGLELYIPFVTAVKRRNIM